MLADLISSKKPAILSDDLSVARYSGAQGAGGLTLAGA
jgi:D-amino-acid dehydrogenase